MRNQPAGPEENFLKQIQMLRKDFLGYLTGAAEQYGEIVYLKPTPATPLYLVNSPELVREVLVTQSDKFLKSAMTRRMVGKYLGNGLIINEGEPHLKQRQKIQPTFHTANLVDYCSRIYTLTMHCMGRWPKDKPFDFEEEMTRLTLQIISNLLFGSDGGENQIEIGEAMTTFSHSMSQRFKSLPMPDWLPLPRHQAQNRAIRRMDEIVYRMAALRLIEIDQEPDTFYQRRDLLSLLIAGEDEEGRRNEYVLKQIRDELVTLFFAGHETTAKSLTWTLYLLKQHPEVENRLKEEIATKLNGRAPTLDDIGKLGYLDQVLRESLRLYPPAWLFDRMPNEDVELGGYLLPRGCTLYVSPYVIQRSPRYYDEPDHFMPERFEPGWEAGRHKYTYFPFGGGRRFCVGQALAELEAKVVLAALYAHGAFSLLPNQDFTPEPGATLRPQNGLMVKFLLSA